MARYVQVLETFADAPERGRGTGMTEPIEWDPFPFKIEYEELRRADWITGSIASSVTGPTFVKGTLIIFKPGITPLGLGKLAELSRYLWDTSLIGRIASVLLQMLWLVVGLVLGVLGTVLSGWFQAT